MSTNNHIIKINNFNNNDKLSYSVAIIKGEITSNNKCNAKDNVDFAVLHNDNTSNSKSLINNDRFMQLICLKPGKNEISVTYCCTRVHLVLQFEPIASEYYVVPLYIVCNNHDGKFQSPADTDNSLQSALDRIDLGTKLIQCLVAEKFYEIGLSRKTFQIEADLKPLAGKCRVFSSDLDVEIVRKMSQEELWCNFGRELMDSKIASDKFKYLAFISCTRYRGDKFNDSVTTHEDIVRLTEAYAALGGGGLAIFGSACLHTWPTKLDDVSKCFEDKTLIDKTIFMDDSCYRGTYGGCFATTLGSVCHELCHTFDLGHTVDGIMGRGFDEINTEFTLTPLKESKVLKKLPPEKQHCVVDFTPNIKVTQSILPNNRKSRDDLSKICNPTKPIHKKVSDNKSGVYWTRSCSILLYYHRWLNKTDNSNHNIDITETRLVKSSAGICVAEIRNNNTGLVLEWWDFSGEPRKTFQIPEMNALSIDIKQPLILIVEDLVGNILKHTF